MSRVSYIVLIEDGCVGGDEGGDVGVTFPEKKTKKNRNVREYIF